MSTYLLTPLNVGEIIERFFSVLGRSITRLLGLLLIVAVPAALILGVAMDTFFSMFTDLDVLNDPSAIDEETATIIVRSVAVLVIGILFFLVADVVALLTMQMVVCGEIVDRHIGLRESLELSFDRRLGRAIGQRFLGEFASVLAILGPYMLLPIVITSGGGGAAIGLVLLLIAVALGLFLYLRMRWAFGTTSIAWEDETVLGAFTRSGYLVRDHGWRTFGILAVFAIVISVALSVLVLPIQFMLMKDILMLGMEESVRNVALLQSTPDPLETLASIGLVYGIVAGVANLLTTMLKSVYLPILYFDLRARKNEFDQPEEGAAASL